MSLRGRSLIRILIVVTYFNKLSRLTVRGSTVSRFQYFLHKRMVFLGSELLRDKICSYLDNVRERVVNMFRRLQTTTL